jgi:hypothetical protein
MDFFPPLEQNGLKLGCNVKIVYGNLKSEISQDYGKKPQAEFLDVIGTKVFRVFLLASHNLYKRIYPPPPSPSKSGLKLVCNVNILYGNLKSENSQDYAQKSLRNCMFMGWASGHA